MEGGKGYVAPPLSLSNYFGGGAWPPPPLPTPMSLRIAGLSKRVIPAGNRSRFDQAPLLLVELVRSVG